MEGKIDPSVTSDLNKVHEDSKIDTAGVFLSPAQLEIVNSNQDFLAIIGVPGTGKTYCLVTKIAKTYRELKKSEKKGLPAISVSNGYEWGLNLIELTTKRFELTYDTATDVYSRGGTDDVQGWENGVFSTKSIFRGNLKDMEQIFLAKTEGSQSGKIAWKFSVLSNLVTFKNLRMYIPIDIIIGGRALLRVSSGSEDVFFKESSSDFEDAVIVPLVDCRELTVELKVFGSEEGFSWPEVRIIRRTQFPTNDDEIFRIDLQIE